MCFGLIYSILYISGSGFVGKVCAKNTNRIESVIEKEMNISVLHCLWICAGVGVCVCV